MHDGDTLTVAGVGKVRLIGIDVPEYRDSERDDFYRRRFDIAPETLRETARRAHQLTLTLAEGKEVSLSFDEERRDRHGRTLAYVTLPDGRLLNRLLLELGLAAVYRRFDFRLKDQFLAAERQARDNRLGLWNDIPTAD